MGGRVKRFVCDACALQAIRVGWEGLRLPHSVEACQAMRQVVFGKDVQADLKPCPITVGVWSIYRASAKAQAGG